MQYIYMYIYVVYIYIKKHTCMHAYIHTYKNLYQIISVHIIFSFYSHSFSTSIIQRVTSQTSSMSPLFVRFEAAFSAETEIHAGFAVRSRTCRTRSSKSLGRMLNITIFGTTK